jgi:hypothetical protein
MAVQASRPLRRICCTIAGSQCLPSDTPGVAVASGQGLELCSDRLVFEDATLDYIFYHRQGRCAFLVPKQRSIGASGFRLLDGDVEKLPVHELLDASIK